MAQVVANLVVGYAVTILASAFQKAKKFKYVQPEYDDNSIMVRTATAPRSVVYGRTVNSGPLVYVASSGADDEYLHMVVPVAAHKVAAIEDVYFNDSLASGANHTAIAKVKATMTMGQTRAYSTSNKISITINGQLFVANELRDGYTTTLLLLQTIWETPGYGSFDFTVTLGQRVGYGNEIIVEAKDIDTELVVTANADSALWDITIENEAGTFHTLYPHEGSHAQAADAELVAAVPDEWTSAHRLAGMAYVHAQLQWEVRQWTAGPPAIKAIIKGALVYDPRAAKANITGCTLAGVFSTDTPHGLAAGDMAWLGGHTGGTPAIAKKYEVLTVPSSTTFTLANPATGAVLTFTTAGSGGTVSRCSWSQNAALCIRDYIAMPYGLSCDDDEINDATVIAAANVCEETVNVLQRSIVSSGTGLSAPGVLNVPGHGVVEGGTIVVSGHTGSVPDINGTHVATVIDKDNVGIPVTITTGGSGGTLVLQQPRYTCNGAITLNQQPMDILAKLTTTGVRAVRPGGVWELYAEAYTAPVATIDESDLAGALEVQTINPRKYRFNAVRGTYRDPNKYWQITDFPVVSNALYESEDGERIERDINLPFTADPYEAQRLAKIELERSRQGIALKWPGQRSVFRLAPMDTVAVNLDYLGFVGKEFKVTGWDFADFADTLVLAEEAPGIYDWNYGNETTVDLSPNTTLPNPFSMPAPAAPVVTEEKYNAVKSSGVRVRTVVKWAAVAYPGVEYQLFYRYELTSAGAWLDGGKTKQLQQTLHDMVPGIVQLFVRALGLGGVYADSPVTRYTVQGLTDKPANVTGLSMNIVDRMALFEWDEAPDLDVRVGGTVVARFSSKLTGAEWADGEAIGGKIAGNSTGVQLPLLTGTYMFKFRDSEREESLSAAKVSSNAADILAADIVADNPQQPDFAGLAYHTIAVDNLAKLSGSGFWDDEPGNMDSWGFVDSLGGLFADGAHYFDAPIDLGGVFNVRARADMATTAEGAARATLQIRHSAVSSATQYATQELAKLVASDGAASDLLGHYGAAAINADGTAVVLGAYAADVGGNTDQGAVYVYELVAGSWVETKLVASDGEANDHFGHSVAIDAGGTTVVVGSKRATVGANTDQGAVYVYELVAGSWVETKLVASDGTNWQQLGYGVAITPDGTTIAAGTYTGTATAQAVYLFELTDNWAEIAKLQPSDGIGTDYFGTAVAITPDAGTVVVGAYGKDNGANTDQGAVYHYTDNGNGTWTETKLLATGAGFESQTGWRVDVSDDGRTVVAGAKWETVDGRPRQGCAYCFTRTGAGWVDVRITGSSPLAYDSFGYDVALSADGRWLVVGAAYANDAAGDQGAVYVYQHKGGTTWGEIARITASDGVLSDCLGSAVAITPDAKRLVAGAFGVDVSASGQGAGYVFELDANWSAWQNFIVGEYTARAFDFRALLTADGNNNIHINELNAILDMDERPETHPGLAVPAAGLRINYNYEFYIAPAIGVTIYGMQSGDHYAITNATVAGFDLQIINGGAGVARTVDVIARGAGLKTA